MGKLVVATLTDGDQEHSWEDAESLERAREVFRSFLPTHTAFIMTEPGKGVGPVREIRGDEPEVFMHPAMAGG